MPAFLILQVHRKDTSLHCISQAVSASQSRDLAPQACSRAGEGRVPASEPCSELYRTRASAQCARLGNQTAAVSDAKEGECCRCRGLVSARPSHANSRELPLQLMTARGVSVTYLFRVSAVPGFILFISSSIGVAAWIECLLRIVGTRY